MLLLVYKMGMRDRMAAAVLILFVCRYNEHMGGVDHLNQMRSYYSLGRAGRRWWKYLIWGLHNVGIIVMIIIIIFLIIIF